MISPVHDQDIVPSASRADFLGLLQVLVAFSQMIRHCSSWSCCLQYSWSSNLRAFLFLSILNIILWFPNVIRVDVRSSSWSLGWTKSQYVWSKAVFLMLFCIPSVISIGYFQGQSLSTWPESYHLHYARYFALLHAPLNPTRWRHKCIELRTKKGNVTGRGGRTPAWEFSPWGLNP